MNSDLLYGLTKDFRTLVPPEQRDADSIPGTWPTNPPGHLTPKNMELIQEIVLSLTSPKLIVEIGVDAVPKNMSSTGILLEHKPSDCTYIGIDINPKSHVNNAEKKQYTIQGSSANHTALYTLMKQLGLNQIDLMFVDGWHSVNAVWEEWKYWEKMSPNGIMIFHDITWHPGPKYLFECIDEEIFDVRKQEDPDNDFGIGVVRRK